MKDHAIFLEDERVEIARCAELVASRCDAISDLKACLLSLPRNSAIHDANQAAFLKGGDAPLRAPLKTRPGVGQSLPGIDPPQVMPVSLAVGDAFGAPFPATTEIFSTLDDAQLNRLAIMANHNFNIVVGDTVRQRREKFKKYICGLM